MSSLFGGQNANQSNSQPTPGSGLFGSTPNAGNQPSSGGGLFGSNTATGNHNQLGGGLATGGLFGSGAASANKPPQITGGGLFGSSIAATQPGTTGGLFGASAVNNTQTHANAASNTSSGLFGSSANTTQPSAGGLFRSGTNTTQTSTSTGLFGQNNTSNTNPSAPAGIFGSTTNQNNTAGASLFGGAQNTSSQNNNTGTSLFGGAQNTPNQASTSLFGNTMNNSNANRPSLFGGGLTSNQPQNQAQPQQQLGSSLYGPPTVSVGAQGHLVPSASLQRLQMSGFSTTPNEKKVADQIMTIAEKWNPESEKTILKSYLYNAVDKSYAPFFYPDARTGEDERSWEEALSKRPTMPKVEGAESTALAFVPVMCRGFRALGERVEVQVKSMLEMRNRLHEMNNSLSAVMDRHQQHITVNIENAKRQHQILSQRCLRLAVKVQVLRNRGYALDQAEESLRLTLRRLDQQIQDPALSGREDEIWARMVALRERTRWLEEEIKRVAAQVDDQNPQAPGSANNVIPEDVLLKTKRILKDYDGQLTHLKRELEEVQKEFITWEGIQR